MSMQLATETRRKSDVHSVMPMRFRIGWLQRKCCEGKEGTAEECEECRAKRTSLQCFALNGDKVKLVPPIVGEVLRSGGTKLDESSRRSMEARFGHDFSGVVIHTSQRAAESAEVVQAKAYTVGEHIVFGSGEFAPSSSFGQRLLAHELAHVVQQENASSNGLRPEIGDANSGSENEADDLAEKVASNESITEPTSPATPALLRQTKTTAGDVRRLAIFEPGPEQLQHLGDAAKTLQRYVGSLYSRLAEKTSALNPIAPVFYPQVSKIDGEVGEMLRQALLGRLSAQQYADIVYVLSSAKKRLDSIVFQAGLARPSKGGQVVSEFVDPYGETVDLTDVNNLMQQLLPKGILPGTPVEYGTEELLHKK